MTISMDHHDTFLSPHTMIPNISTLPHLVSLVTPNSSTQFTPSLIH
jgi:hypothetical protein